MQTDRWHAARQRVVIACRAHGLRPLDGAFGDIKDAAGFLPEIRRAAAMGFAGRMAIHSSQIAPSNEAFSPSAAEPADARRVLAAMNGAGRARQTRRGAGGWPPDRCSQFTHAQNIVGTADAIAAAARK